MGVSRKEHNPERGRTSAFISPASAFLWLKLFKPMARQPQWLLDIKGFISETMSCQWIAFFSLMRWNVAKLTAERQSISCTTIKWSFTKHTQYALDVGFVKAGWPSVHSNEEGVYLDVGRWRKMPNWNHPSQCNKKACSTLSGWEECDDCIGPVSFPVRQRMYKWTCKC